jgi:hypothetical protein
MTAFTRIAAAAAVVSIVLCVSSTQAAVYRCKHEGHVSYQQFRCHADSEPMRLHGQSGWSALRPGEKRLLQSYRERQSSRQQPMKRDDTLTRSEQKACWKKRRQLEALNTRLRRGYRLRDSDRLRQNRDNYQDYLRDFCP